MTKRILFTGGGSAGHVTVNLALIPLFLAAGWEVTYIGSRNGIESQLIEQIPAVKYVGISTGKLRRYVDMENVKDPFRIVKGVFEAYRAIKKVKPHVVFSKGGFVSVPVVLGAWLNRVPIVIHESDLTPGLANKICAPFATTICTTFPETSAYLNRQKALHVGAIVREQLREGSAATGLALCGFHTGKPVLLFMGGSLGSQRINAMLRTNLLRLVNHFQIVHICGKNQLDQTINHPNYKQFEYVNQELPHVLAMADFVISRAGSNTIFECLALRKPMLLIPLSKQASRGDQILNAQSFQEAGFCEVLLEEEMNDTTFVQAIQHLVSRQAEIQDAMKNSQADAAVNRVVALIEQTTAHR
ncbi:undecaprenyldiphospho-muramoylpentapeptide beta-N-acetylglucosaminyltransferase [Paenibacillus sp. 481]|uniref:undecaprenyldiphospho-muramoylpentapeptide beta-N-acetylglucosaminyltransferase n=1 Tax=Paenibacillus sp. 481 TaxID=2835869 RepID=UPI001E49F727|nr:undecaprenyldiphospho-muramoylpentapeptide beta-N-acetylglucosaminyltransferase [Paenibacillus sp. 481]UHA73659.1 undecaprenyldiphospho-muramoylpentapeptide beta-N-acetylglucosaminyltransferase [Paenibacillus sp. 481]